MHLEGERRIPASREAVWAALNDPAVLRASIPGCEQLTQTADNAFEALVSVKVGPVKARMEGAVTLGDINPPVSYSISGKGKGAAGFAAGEAKVALAEEEGGTLLSYTVEAKIGGKLAEVGARFIDSTAQKMADQFFDSFVAQVTGGTAAASGTISAVADGPAPAKNAGLIVLLAAVAIVGGAALYWLLS
ncbi:MAG: carbon monoxide dehydrogenase subunit G [Novosphingobium sp.]